jgi:hypothetical protein
MTHLKIGRNISNQFLMRVSNYGRNLGSNLLFLTIFIIIIILRETDLLIYPRLWAEEGKIFYSFARHNTIFDILTSIHVGYITLFNSFVSILQAKIFDVEYVAIVSTYLGFLVQLSPILIILFTSHKFWDSSVKYLICFLIIIQTPPELWLNTTNSHFIFGLITFLILIVHTYQLNSWKKWVFRIFLFFSTLTGPSSMLLTPVFLLKAYYDKTREKWIQALLVTVLSLIQAFVIIYCILYNNQYSRLKQHYNFIQTVYTFFIDHFCLNLTIFPRPIMILLGLLMALYFISLLFKYKNNREYQIFFLSFAFVAVFSTAGSLDMAGSPRYGYIPSGILVILIIQEARNWLQYKRKISYALGVFIIMVFLALNTVFYKSKMDEVYSSNYPKWKNEVKKWRIDVTYKPKIHPFKNILWEVEL